MAKYLVIVESPAKVKTIKKFLGSNYDVQASNGHVRDFPKSQFGIDVENDFEPKYITIRGKRRTSANLRKAAKKADTKFISQLTPTVKERQFLASDAGIERRSGQNAPNFFQRDYQDRSEGFNQAAA